MSVEATTFLWDSKAVTRRLYGMRRAILWGRADLKYMPNADSERDPFGVLINDDDDRMSLLREIQQSLMEQGPISPILLKLRFLASRLGSGSLEEWVKYESEGYPNAAELPSYRFVPLSYTGTFSGPFGSGISNAPIPPALIQQFAGSNWNSYAIRQSVAAIDKLLTDDEGSVEINASDLILLLQGKIYKGYACNGVKGILSTASLSEVQEVVRARALELTLEIEKSVPTAADITISGNVAVKSTEGQVVSQITNQVIHGNFTSITNTGSISNISINIGEGIKDDVVKALEDAGLPQSDAIEFATILSKEKPANGSTPFGAIAIEWIKANLPKALSGAWKMGLSSASELLTEAAKKYYGLN